MKNAGLGSVWVGILMLRPSDLDKHLQTTSRIHVVGADVRVMIIGCYGRAMLRRLLVAGRGCRGRLLHAKKSLETTTLVAGLFELFLQCIQRTQILERLIIIVVVVVRVVECARLPR